MRAHRTNGGDPALRVHGVARRSHPECVVLLGQVGEDVRVENGGLQEVAPQSGQPGAELAHVPADLLRHALVAFL